MLDPKPARAALALSLLAAASAGLAAVSGLRDPGLYAATTPPELSPGALSQDTIAVLAALGIAGLSVAILRGWRKGWLLWAGLTGYIAYAYVLYGFDGVYNRVFPAYLVALSGALWALLVFLRHVRRGATGPKSPDLVPPRRLTALLFALLGLLFLGLWSSILWPAMSAGTAPAGNAIFVQDLTLVLPLLFFTSWALLQAGPTGDLIAVPLLVKMATLGVSVFLGTLYGPFFDQPIRIADLAVYGALGFLPLALLPPWLRRIDVLD